MILALLVDTEYLYRKLYLVKYLLYITNNHGTQ